MVSYFIQWGHCFYLHEYCDENRDKRDRGYTESSGRFQLCLITLQFLSC